MHTYPLHFKTGMDPAEEPLTITDAKKNVLLFRPKISDAMAEGKSPVVFYADQSKTKEIYTVNHREADKVKKDEIFGADGKLFGSLNLDTKHNWKVLDENSMPVASIQEKNSFKNNLLFEILKPGESSDNDPILKLVVPHHYVVTIKGKKAMELKEDASATRSDYSLKKSIDLTEKEESLLLVCLMITLAAKV